MSRERHPAQGCSSRLRSPRHRRQLGAGETWRLRIGHSVARHPGNHRNTRTGRMSALYGARGGDQAALRQRLRCLGCRSDAARPALGQIALPGIRSEVAAVSSSRSVIGRWIHEFQAFKDNF